MYTTAVTAGAQVAIAIGTFAAVFVALFGNWLRGQIAPPRLKLTLENDKGQKEKTFVVSPSGEKRDTLLRSYQVRVENERRWSPAQEVQVYLLSVEEPDVTGTNKPNWVGEIPIQWQNQKIHPLTRTIGHAANCEWSAPIEWSSLNVSA